MTFLIRKIEQRDFDPAAALWHAGWHEAHAEIVPQELVKLRTQSNFRSRLLNSGKPTWVAGDKPIGLFILDGDELEQFYVSATARGTGLAGSMMNEAELQLRAAGHTRAWLDCAIGNKRAARFYEKCGWTKAGKKVSQVDTSEGDFELEIWRFEKTLEP